MKNIIITILCVIGFVFLFRACVQGWRAEAEQSRKKEELREKKHADKIARCTCAEEKIIDYFFKVVCDGEVIIVRQSEFYKIKKCDPKNPIIVID